MKKHSKIVIILLAATLVTAGAAVSGAGDPAAGKVVFETKCHTCHAALPAFLRYPRRYNPKTAMTFPGLKSTKDIDDVIAYIKGRN